MHDITHQSFTYLYHIVKCHPTLSDFKYEYYCRALREN